MGELFADSHASLRHRYEVSSSELDAMVDLVRGTPGVVGARVTGAGFGGCVVLIVEKGSVEDLRGTIMTEYPKRTGLTPRVFVVEPAGCAGFL